jgi:voltage-gated potassium channel
VRRRKGIATKIQQILVALLIIIVIGTIGFKIIGGNEKSFLDAFYMTVMTITTVGYADVIGLDKHPLGKLFATVYMLAGTGTVLYLLTTFAAFMIGGELKKALRRRTMERRIAKMHDHFIVCGIGMVGLYVVHELFITKVPLIAVDVDEEKIEFLRAHQLNVDLLVGDATENEVLWDAMIEHAKGLFATTNSDNDNIVIALTAKQMNPSLRVVCRCNDTKNIDKIRRAGADAVVALNYIGGIRMASEMVRPTVTSFIDKMLRDKETPMKVEELTIGANSPYVGRPVGDIDFKGIGNILVIAARASDGEWIYNPYPGTMLEKDMSLIILATRQEKELLQALVSTEIETKS